MAYDFNSPEAKQQRLDVYQEGQRAFHAGAGCPYTDWRMGTWEKGRAAAEKHRAAIMEDARKAQAENERIASLRWDEMSPDQKIEHLLERIEALEDEARGHD